jgi:hypothetical protein
MAQADRQARAEARRGRVVLRKSSLQAVEEDLSPVRGAEAISLGYRLTREAWSLSGQEEPVYTRRETSWRFVPRKAR